MTFDTHPNNTTKYNSELYQINMTILQEIMYLKERFKKILISIKQNSVEKIKKK